VDRPKVDRSSLRSIVPTDEQDHLPGQDFVTGVDGLLDLINAIEMRLRPIPITPLMRMTSK
jgi:hypothetical protein